MKQKRAGLQPGQRQIAALSAFMLLQSVAAAFFVGDVFWDLMNDLGSPHSLLEAFVVFVLISGIFLAGWQLKLTMHRMQYQERALATARGELSGIIETQFTEWGLTPAERDVGLLALKGLDLTTIAQMRGAAQGTVRAQLTKIYAKAGVSGRHQFAAWFVEDLLDEGLSTNQSG
ncbi:helix-turn-helix transcriptional regulator [Roseibium salinum]|uniref:LuxR family transcriptional regulator n=1 Tax=Roseibium salinum TaxID=1604349 RepID=A0ABT3R7S3_9HYPH|nr:LuxR family transcriptional regulator [Roseibium sp. DSM 29163]MCX2725179.1 LuxR family transcriptional regulator [Roseibium sp. DSM 29163]